MKIDVMTSQTCEDDPKLAANSPITSRHEDLKTRQRRWGAANCRLAEQVEAEKVLLSSDISRLKNQGDWKDGEGRGGDHQGEEDANYGRCSSQGFERSRGNKLGGCEELYWANASDEDTANTVGVASVDDFHTMDRNATARTPRGPPRVSCTPPSPGEKALDVSPMETDIAEFFPAARSVTASLEVSMRKQGLSPRQRLLYRYQMEEMLTMQENNGDDEEEEEEEDEDISADMPDMSGDMPDMSGDVPADGSAEQPPFLSGVGFSESPGSPYSWNASSGSVGGGPDYSLDESSGRCGSFSGGLVRDCHICGYAPCSRDDYDSHMKRTHFTHKCHLCIYWSRSPGRLSRHMKTFHGEPNTADSPANRKPKNPRKYACKQCEFFTYVQEEIWNHTRVHVPASKLLSCPHCPFVCAFKHHMQYHMNNHLGHKPYRCSECNYRCNNKSMLNSHRKSHSNDYPYRCGVCNYAAKYRHALNIHLRKKRHFADGEVVLEDGGTRYGRSRNTRGGATSSGNLAPEVIRRLSPPRDEITGSDVAMTWQQASQQDNGVMDYDIVKKEPDTVDHSISTPYLHAVQQNAVYALNDGGVQPSLLSISDLPNVKLMRYSPVVQPPRTTPTTVARNGDVSRGGYNPARGNSSSIPSISVFSASFGDHDHSSLYETNHHMVSVSPGRRFPPRGTNYRTVDINLDQDPRSHKGLAPSVRDCPGEFTLKERPLDLTSKPRNINTSTDSTTTANNHRNSWGGTSTEKVPRSCRYECQYCGIIFPERILYSMHMEYHGQAMADDPFQCNLCGQRTKDRREFFNHINQVAHKSAI